MRAFYEKFYYPRGLAENETTPAYFIYSATVAEVELDVLTGETNIVRVDIVEDTGTSVNPEVDVGQVEGAFVMSLGMWLTEQLRYDPDTGRLLTRDTWEYKVPSSKDIPQVSISLSIRERSSWKMA